MDTGTEKISVKPNGILDNLTLHYPNEAARHKLLDVIGDLALTGTRIRGKVIANACRGNGRTNAEARRHIRTAYEYAMSGDGSVFPCGHWFAIERDRFIMGNVNDTRLSDIFKSERYWEVQNEIHKLDMAKGSGINELVKTAQELSSFCDIPLVDEFSKVTPEE